MNTDFNELERQLIKVLDEFLVDREILNYPNDKEWTRQIKMRIGKLGEDLSNKVAIGGFGDDFEREWLYDIVWYREDDQSRLLGLHLIVESEWDKNYKGIKYDFEKLLVGKADLRMMICQARESEIEVLLKKFVEAINTHLGIPGERYFFAILNYDTEDQFVYKTYTKSHFNSFSN